MLTTAPKVSVLVPVYNAEKFIADTIRAVLNQTFTDFELILLDDASTDRSAEIISSFTDKRLSYVKSLKNLGISGARNKLLSMARGEYSAVLDHDDLCLPTRLEEQVRFLDKHPKISLVGSYFELYCPPYAPFWRRLLTNLGWVWCHPLRPKPQDALNGNVLMHPTLMYRTKDILENTISYDPDLSPAEDYDFVRQALKAGLKIANLPKILLKYNLYGGNCSLLKKQKMKEADCAVKRLLAADLELRESPFCPYFLVVLQKLRLKYFMRDTNV